MSICNVCSYYLAVSSLQHPLSIHTQKTWSDRFLCVLGLNCMTSDGAYLCQMQQHPGTGLCQPNADFHPL